MRRIWCCRRCWRKRDARIFKSRSPLNDLRPAIDVTLRELSKSVEFFRFGEKLKVLPKRAKTVCDCLCDRAKEKNLGTKN